MKQLLPLASFLALVAILPAQNARESEMISPGLIGLPAGIAIESENADLSALIYEDSGDSSIWLRLSDGRGLDWATPIRIDDDITGAAKSTSRHSLRVDGERIYLAWRDQRNGSFDDVYFTSSDDSGATWLPSNQRLDGGFPTGANDVKDFRIGSGGKDVVVICSTDNGDEALYVTWSNNEGKDWNTALSVTTHNGLADVDNIAIACENDVAYIVWRDNFLNGVDDTIWMSIFDFSLGTFIAQDLNISPNLIAAGGDADDSVDVAVDQTYVAVIYHADNLGGTSEQLRVNMSSDLGVTWSGDVQLGAYDNATLNHDVDNGVTLVEDGLVAVAWEDNRTGQDEVYCAVAPFATGVFSADHLCSNSTTGAANPHLAGEFNGEALAVSWSQFDGETYNSCYFINDVWSPSFVVSDNLGDVDDTKLAWNDAYNNFLSLWAADDSGVNQVFVGGYRAQQIDPGTPVAGTVASFHLSGFRAGDAFQVVASMSPGSYLLADGRFLGLAADSYLMITKDLPQFRGSIAMDGTGATAPLPVPSGLSGATMYLVAVGLDVSWAVTELSDATYCAIQ